jgi:hypothetical protein
MNNIKKKDIYIHYIKIMYYPMKNYKNDFCNCSLFLLFFIMNFSSNPPPPSADHPSLDTVVTVDNCWYYLSLLEQFVQATQDLPNAILQQYLVRAEYRYFRWISNKEALVQEKHVPPIGKQLTAVISLLI